MSAFITVRPPSSLDGSAVWSLVASCPPLDLNSPYAYMMLGEYFADTCAVAESAGRVVGFLSGFVPPGRADTLFVWQVAVRPEERKKGIALSLLESVLARPKNGALRYLETTIGPSNAASRRLFQRFAAARNAPCRDALLFSREQFGGDAHEDERRYVIGPFQHIPAKEPANDRSF